MRVFDSVHVGQSGRIEEAFLPCIKSKDIMKKGEVLQVCSWRWCNGSELYGQTDCCGPQHNL